MNSLKYSVAALVFALTTQGAEAQLADKVVSSDDIRVSNHITSALKSDRRPADEKARDANRQPGKIMAFFDI